MAGKNPFKGLYCYEEADKDIFFGRDNEAAELFSLVALNGLTVVFGKSGIGKTSLLNAGLFPLLREKDFLPVRMRLDYSSGGLPLLQQVKQAIQRELEKHDIVAIEKGGSELAGTFGEGESLWEYFHRVDHISKSRAATLNSDKSFCGGSGGEAAPPPQEGPAGHLESRLIAAPNVSDSSRDTHHSSLIIHHSTVTPVLVFDQFEELFTIGKHHAEREKFLEELYWLIEDQVPPEVKERVLTSREVVPYLRSQAVVRVVFGIREDYLPHMNALKRRIPSIHRVLYRIIHMNGIQAREVMDKSGAFREEKIRQELLQQFYPADMEPGQAVSDEKLEVEPALLSLLCYQVYERGVETLSGREKDAILADFYDQVLGELPRGKALSEWIENHLLTEGGFRTPLYLERGHELRETVDAAVDKKLLRKLYIGEKEHVEIIHDVLTPVIRERRNRRIEGRKRKIITIISMVAILSIFLAVFAFIQMNRADEQKKIAEQKEQVAIREKNRADEQYKIAVINKLSSESGQILLINKEKAIRIAEAAYKISKLFPPAAVVRALCSAAYSTRKHPFYTASFNPSNIKAKIRTAVFSPDGIKTLTVSVDNNVTLWGLTGKSMAEMNGHFTSAVFSPDGNKILTASENMTAKLWNLSGKLLATSIGHKDNINSAVFSPDGNKILTASDDGTAKLWDLWGNLLVDFPVHSSEIRSAVFSPDGSKILTASRDNTAKLMDLRGNILSKLMGHKYSVNIAIFSPDGSKIFTASADRTAKLWDLTGKLLTDFKELTGSVRSAMFSPDGSKILTVSWTNTVKLWDLKGNILADFKGHKYNVNAAVFSSDGSKILTASDDNTAKLWDLQGSLLADLQGHTDSVNSAVFSPNGKRIVTASSDGTAIVWLTPEGIMEYLKTAPIPKLTQKEKEELGIAGFKID